MLHGTIRRDDFKRYNIVSNDCNTVPTFEPCVLQKLSLRTE